MIAGAFAAAAEQMEGAKKWDTPGVMAAKLDRHTKNSAALDLLDAELVKVSTGETPRLMFFMPPQEGKSQRVSRRFPAWLLAHDPTLRVGIVSYQEEKAVRWGRDIKRDVETHPELGISLRADSQAAGRWHTEQGGGVVCVGIGGALTGEPVDVLIIDDPVKDRADAESIKSRTRAWDWWESVGQMRLSARGVVVMIMTRWHEDDLAGRLLKAEGGEWRVISVPAIAEEGDPLRRRPGEELRSVQGRKPGHFAGLQAKLSPYVWRSVMQQHPTASEGNLFRRGDWQFWRPVTTTRLRLDDHDADVRDCMRFITIDLATSTRTSADYTVAAAWAISPGGDLILLDRARSRVEDSGHFDLVAPIRQRYLQAHDVVHVESRMFGTTFVYAAGRAGIPIAELDADVDKFTRALPLAGLVHQRRVWLPAEADWLDEWLDEYAEFPSSAHDDQVDVGGYAARVALAHWIPAESAREEMDRLTTADDGIDFESVAL